LAAALTSEVLHDKSRIKLHLVRYSQHEYKGPT
jgi:hypothetical protein